jgi:hypothetical protein
MRRREFIAGLGTLAGEAVCQSNPIFAQAISGVAHRTVQANGINLHFAEMGEGPLVVLGHGFPECWYSWRHIAYLPDGWQRRKNWAQSV